MDVLELKNISKRFGDRRVLCSLSLTVPEHTVFGLIGRNGAGKTTTMKIVLGFLRADEGEARVCGERVRYGGARTNRNIGYLPDVPEFYGYMRPSEYLAFCGRVAGMPSARIRERSAELLAMVGLGGEKGRIRGFSRGMKQRLGIAQALLGNPRLLVCDEPTSALDPVGRKEILDLLSAAGEKTSILFSTHILSDVERVCSRVAILDSGKIALQGPLEEIRGRFRENAVSVRAADRGGRELAGVCGELPFVSSAEAVGDTVTLKVGNAERDGPKLLALLAEKRIPVLKYEVLEPTLEDVFLEAIE